MKHLILIAAIAMLVGGCYGIFGYDYPLAEPADREEYEVIATLIDTLFGGSSRASTYTLLVCRYTTDFCGFWGDSADFAESMMKRFGMLDSETSLDMMRANRGRFRWGEKFPANRNFEWCYQQEQTRLPREKATLQFSRVGFNRSRSEALVTVQGTYESSHAYLVKRGSRWVFIKMVGFLIV